MARISWTVPKVSAKPEEKATTASSCGSRDSAVNAPRNLKAPARCRFSALRCAEHPSCFANLVGAFEPYGISPDRISTTLNVFMDVWTDLDGELHIDPPPTVPGDRFAVQAEDDILVGITACSAEKSNTGRCTPIDYRVAAP